MSEAVRVDGAAHPRHDEIAVQLAEEFAEA
jgi:hypothetical protein